MQFDATRTYSRTRRRLRSNSFESPVTADATQATITIDMWGLVGVAALVFLLVKVDTLKFPFLSK